MGQKSVAYILVLLISLLLIASCAPEPAAPTTAATSAPLPTATLHPATTTPLPPQTETPGTSDMPPSPTAGSSDGWLNGDSFSPSISADGRWVSFASFASNLVADDLNESTDIFLYDRSAKESSLISRGVDGAPAGSSGEPVISANGSWVAFFSGASNMVPLEKKWDGAIYLYNRLDGTITLGSLNNEGTPANGRNTSPSLSADGRLLAFESNATNLTAGVNENWMYIYVRDRQTGQTELVSIGADGSPANDFSRWPVISYDGRYVAFWSLATNLTPGEPEYCRTESDPGPCLDIYVFDRETRSMERIAFGQSSGIEWGGFELSLSADGRFLAYFSNIYDRQTLTTESICEPVGVGVCAYSPKLSSNGRWVAYVTAETPSQVSIYDRQTGESTQISLDPGGKPSNADAGRISYEAGFSGDSEISLDGRLVIYASQATNLVTADLGLCEDQFAYTGPRPCYGIFLFDRQTGLTEIISHPNPPQTD